MILKKGMPFIIVFLFSAYCLISSLLFGKEKAAGMTSGRPLSEILNPDGTLKVGDGVQGSFDPRGFRMVSGPSGQPKFVPAGSGFQIQGDAFLAAAGDENWDSQFNIFYTNNTVYAIAVSSGIVYVGGSFTDAGGVAGADYIAKWNGSSWSPLGTGLDGTVGAIAVSGADVYVGGSFTDAGGIAEADNIAKWNGSSWSALGGGLNAAVFSIAVSGSDIYVGGSFTDAGGIAQADRIAKWNGSTWLALGTGLNSYVRVISVSGTDVYVGGSFTDGGGVAEADNIAKWNGSNWSALGTGLNNIVYAIAVSGTNYYVGGSFTDAGGVVEADYVARWNGSSWSALGTGLNSDLRAIAVSGTDIYVGGLFVNAGGNAEADYVAKWNGSSWSALGSGVNSYVAAIAVSGTAAYVGGMFATAGGHTAGHIAKWDIAEGTWPTLGAGLNSMVIAIGVTGTEVYAGGRFTDAGGITQADYIAKWDGSSWAALGSGLNSAVHVIAVNGTDVYVGGEFTDAGGVAEADYIARWNGSSWSALGTGLNGTVYAIAASGTDVYVGGSFVNAGGIAEADRIAKWNGLVWSALGNSLNNSVIAIAVIGTDVYVGGGFTDAGGVAEADCIARWNGSSWSALGSGLNSTVRAIVVSGTDVYVGGEFADAGGVAEADYIARWNGSVWTALGSGLNNHIWAIAESGTDVYVGGGFTDAAGIAEADRIAKWNGSAWSAIGSGLNNYVLALAESGTDVLVGGYFTTAGGNPSYCFGRWMIPLAVASPNGGESWEVGSSHNITWTGTAGAVKIDYSTDNGSTWTTIVASTANDGSHGWTVPNKPSSDCFVRVSDTSDSSRSDSSDAAFTIPGFRVTSPNGGESWIVGSPQTITWASGGSYATVRIELSTNNGSIWQWITSGTSNSGSFPWTVPDMVSSQCLIKISDSADGVPSDVTDAVFSIVPVPSIAVTSPNGGESWTMGSAQNITWTSTGVSANVKIEYSTNSGSSYSTIAGWTANDGTHPWTVPLITSSTCLIRVSDAASPSLFDVSNAVFSIVSIPDRRLTWTAGFSENPAVAAQGSNKLHMVWQDDTPGNYEIYYRKSTDAGVTWTASTNLTSTSGASKNPAVAAETAGRVHLVWEENNAGNLEIYYKKSPDGGATWTANKRLTSTSGASSSPEIAVDSSSNLHVVWYDGTAGNSEVYYTQSTDKGMTWTVAKRLTWTSGGSEFPAIAVDSSDNLHLAWQDNTPGNSEIYYKKSTDGGATWTANKRLTWNSGASEAPVIGADSRGYLHVAWFDDTPGNTEIYHKRSTNAGVNWGTNKRLTWNPVGSHSPDIAVDSSGGVHLVWVDLTPGNPDIYYRKSTDMGATWTTALRLTRTTGLSGAPALGVDASGNVHLVWQDNTPGNYEIYYKKFK